MNEELIKEKKKLGKLMFLIVFGILFYLFASSKENLHWGFKIIKPLLSGFVIAYLLNPLVNFVSTKFKIKKGWSILIVLLLLFGLIIFTGAVVIPSLVQNAVGLIQQMPSAEEIDKIVQNIIISFDNKSLSIVMDYINKSLESILKQFGTIATTMLEGFVGKIIAITSGIFSGIVSLVIGIYMLIDKDDLIARFKRMFYAFKKKEDVDYLIYITRRSNEIFSNFFIGKIIDSAIIGILCFAILIVVKIPYASIIALIVGFTNMIPYFGPFIGGVPAVIITLFISPMKALWVAVIIVALQQFDGLYLGPKILGDKVGVRAFWIITSVTVGGVVMGVWGMLLGVPVVVLVKSILEESVEIRLKQKGMEDYEIDKLK